VVEGYTPREGEKMGCDVTYITPDYFKTLGIPLLGGRDFNDQDKVGTPKVAIINETFGRYFFGSANPIGRRIGLENVPDVTIVGVVRDAKYIRLREPMHRHFYTPVMQQTRLFDLVLQAKTVGDPEESANLLRAQVKELDPHLPLYNIKSLKTEIEESLVQERLVTWLSVAFGALATLLAALGLYGVLTFSVAQRTREIGIRVALGAQRHDVFKMIITHGMILVTIGVGLGLGASFALSRLITSLLFGVTPTHVMTFVIVSGVLAFVALLACYIPARRATKVDPLVALRYE
jgi:putative ABC transport system permease protein